MSAIDRFNDGKRWRWHTTGRHDCFRQPLVQRERHHQRIGKRVGNSIYIENRRNLRLAGNAREAFGNIKNQVPLVAAGQSSNKLPSMADAVRLDGLAHVERLQMGDGIRPIKFSGLIFAEARCQVILPQIVRQTNAHCLTLGGPCQRRKGAAVAGLNLTTKYCRMVPLTGVAG